MPQEEKAAYADVIIDNSGSMEDLYRDGAGKIIKRWRKDEE